MLNRAALAPAPQRDRLRNEAATSAFLHQATTGAARLPDLNTDLGLAERMPER